ncbi:MAG: TetR/AcrR family transcriptional regulator [Candidatus Omnitrophica bacterium]|nr:TetR/AcrR family transcriptional regulator [Candidatus Omnitrophota bacterium]
MKRKASSQRKIEIISSAAEILILKGLQDLTIKNLAQRNKISESAIYRHFKDKQSILIGLIDQFENDLLFVIDQPIKNHQNPIEQLKEIMRAHIVFAQKKKSLLFAVTSTAIHLKDDFLRKKILGITDKYRLRIKKILIKAKEEDFLRDDIDIDTASFAFFGLIRSASAHFALTNYKNPPISKFYTLWNIYFHGIEKTKSFNK